MKKQGLRVTSKVLAGLALLTGVTVIPANAVEVSQKAVDVNVKEVKASVYEKNGRYFAKLSADKEIANVVARVVVDKKADFTIKRDIIKAGEVVEVELNLNEEKTAKKLPQTSVVKKTLNTTSEAGKYTFKISVRYEVATEEVKARQKVKDVKPGEASNGVASGNAEKSKEEVKPAEQPKPEVAAKVEKEAEKPAETVVPKPETGNAQPSNKPAGDTLAGRTTFLNAPVAVAPKAKVAPTVMNNAVKATPKAKKQVAQAQAPAKAQVAPQPTATQATSREEQIRRAYINKVNTLRAMNGLTPLKENALLNVSTKNRANTVINSAFNSKIHGTAGSLEKAAAKAAGYPKAQRILYNVAVNTEVGTPDQVAQRLIDSLYKEINNVTKAFPYGHRNTLLAKSATEIGVGVTISNGRVALVHHQDNSGAFQGVTPIPSKYLDGKFYR